MMYLSSLFILKCRLRLTMCIWLFLPQGIRDAKAALTAEHSRRAAANQVRQKPSASFLKLTSIEASFDHFQLENGDQNRQI